MKPMCAPAQLRPFSQRSPVLAVAGLATVLAAFARMTVAGPPDPLPALREQLAQQIKAYGDMETLRATSSPPKRMGGLRESHEFVVRLGGGIQVVSEEHDENGVVLGKDYFLHESEVYALRVWHRVPAPDGTTARITETRFFFDKGVPIHRGSVTVRVPLSLREPDLSKAKETPVPLPPGIEGWAAQLKTRAFAIARSFRPHVGQYVFGNWDEWLLKNAPGDDPGLFPPQRPAGWKPAEGIHVLPIRDTLSPDGLFQIGWGYPKGPIDWAQLSDEPETGAPTFSTKLEGELKPPLDKDSNFLLNAITQEPVGDIGLYHPGERKRFNHDEIFVAWSPSSTCFLVGESGKWGDEAVGIGWIKGGKCEETFEILAPLKTAAEDAVKKSSHPAAKRLRRSGDEGYAFGVGPVLVQDDGTFEAAVIGQIPKDDTDGGSYSAIVSGTFHPGSGDSPAVLKNAKVKVLPP